VLPRDAEEWLRTHVSPTSITVEKDRPWATTWRVETEDDVVFFKACGPVQAFEPRLTAALSERWPDRVTDVVAHDENRAWLLMRDAGIPLAIHGNPPEPWLEVLPRYAELQRGEARYADDHVAHAVPDRRLHVLPAQYEWLAAHDLPLDDDEAAALRAGSPRFAELCAELASAAIPASVQHDDLHMGNVAQRDGRLRIMDWGDASIAHPFFTAVVTFAHLEEVGRLPPGDAWFPRLRDAYLEPWGGGLAEVFDLAYRIGRVAWAISWTRQREHLPAGAVRDAFDRWYPPVLRAALTAV
jgi:hypothetical protein